MPVKRMTAAEIIDDTIEYYRTHPRSLDSTGNCIYDDGADKRCAVGRFMLSPIRKRCRATDLVGLNVLGIEALWSKSEERLTCFGSHDRLLYKKVHGQPMAFWVALQDLHDGDMGWEQPDSAVGSRLSADGKYKVAEMKRRFC